MKRTKIKKRNPYAIPIPKVESYPIDIQVTDHAVIRYLERIEGRNIEEIRKKLITSDICEKVEILGEGTYPLDEINCKIFIKDKKVLTVLEK